MNEAMHLVGAMCTFVGTVVVVSGVLFAAYFCNDVLNMKNRPESENIRRLKEKK